MGSLAVLRAKREGLAYPKTVGKMENMLVFSYTVEGFPEER